MGSAVVSASMDLFGDGLDNCRVIVSQQQGAVPHPVIDELIAIQVPLVCPLRVGDVDRKGLHMARGVRYATRKDLTRLRVTLQGCRESLCELGLNDIWD